MGLKERREEEGGRVGEKRGTAGGGVDGTDGKESKKRRGVAYRHDLVVLGFGLGGFGRGARAVAHKGRFGFPGHSPFNSSKR